jgi:NitT/TauT family transport system permease protein
VSARIQAGGWRRAATTLAFFAAIALAWELAVRAGLWSRVLVPAPLSVGGYLIRAAADGTLLEATWVTLRRLVTGYAAGIAVGLPTGLLCVRARLCKDTLGILALGLQTLPSVCWAPLALLWFGQTEWAVFFITFMGSLWSICLAVEDGVRSVPPIYARAARTMGSRGLHTWLRVVLPASLPFVVSGMKQGWAFAWRSLMAAEIYVTILSGFGLGQLLHYGRELHAMEQVIGVMLLVVAIGLLVDRLVFFPWERSLHRRWGVTG